MGNLETKSNVSTSFIIEGKLNRDLRLRYISMIAIGGVIGTECFYRILVYQCFLLFG